MCLALAESPKTGFLATRPIIYGGYLNKKKDPSQKSSEYDQEMPKSQTPDTCGSRGRNRGSGPPEKSQNIEFTGNTGLGPL